MSSLICWVMKLCKRSTNGLMIDFALNLGIDMCLKLKQLMPLLNSIKLRMIQLFVGMSLRYANIHLTVPTLTNYAYHLPAILLYLEDWKAFAFVVL